MTFFRRVGLLAVLVALLLPASASAADSIYWTREQATESIRVGNLDGSGTASTLGAFSGESAALLAAVLKTPENTQPPAITGGSQVGQELTCSKGDWEPDLLGAFLYRAPAEFDFQWQKVGDGDIPGETASTFTPTDPGDYTCTVTANNPAGSDSQTSDPHQVSAPAPTIDGLIDSVKALGLPRWTEFGLVVELRLAQAFLNRGRTGAACAFLGVFTKHVNALRGDPPRRIAPEDADELIADANAIRASLGCS